MESEQAKLRILMLPWLAHGHATPFFELAKELSMRNFYVYFCSTPIILTSIKAKLAHHHNFSIEPIELNLGSSPDLPPHLHTTKGLPPHLIITLMKAFEDSAPSISVILNDLRPHLIIYDMMCQWVPPLASSLSIPAVYFMTYAAAGAALLHHKLQPRGTEFPFPNIFIRDCYRRPEETSEDDVVFLKKAVSWFEKSSSLVLIKSCNAFEEKYIDYVSVLTKKKIVPVGPLVHPKLNVNEGDDGEMKVIRWLDNKDPFSCVFVSFGSECYLSKIDLEEIAYGLEVSCVNFIWVVRFPTGQETASVEEALPDGFIERIGERGMIIDGWGPQEAILGHPSIGGHVSHCGWGSTVESMYFGVPIIAMPMQHDNPLDARLVEDVGVGIEVMRDEKFKFKREEIAKVIKKVVVESSGEEIRRKAKEVSEKIRAEAETAPGDAAQDLAKLCTPNITASI